MKSDIHKISHASGIREAMTAIKRFSLKWKKTYPNAVNCLLKDEEDLLTFFNVQDP